LSVERLHGNLLARQPNLVVPGKRTVLSIEPGYMTVNLISIYMYILHCSYNTPQCLGLNFDLNIATLHSPTDVNDMRQYIINPMDVINVAVIKTRTRLLLSNSNASHPSVIATMCP
jgi:hypothetical protein